MVLRCFTLTMVPMRQIAGPAVAQRSADCAYRGLRDVARHGNGRPRCLRAQRRERSRRFERRARLRQRRPAVLGGVHVPGSLRAVRTAVPLGPDPRVGRDGTAMHQA